MVLVLDDLGRCFGERWIFRSLSLEARRGEIVRLTGPNGSGKTTLLKVVATLLTPSEGDGAVCGHSLAKRPELARRHLGWAPAMEGGFFPRLTGRENLLFHGYLGGLRRREIDDRLGELPRLGTLSAALETPYYLCSAGMRQVLHLARVWLGRPALFVLDEPSRSLDSETRGEMAKLLAVTAETSAVLVATHSYEPWEGTSVKELRLERATT